MHKKGRRIAAAKLPSGRPCNNIGEVKLVVCDFWSNLEGGGEGALGCKGEGGEIQLLSFYYNAVCSREDLNIVSFL